jgi:hypothetical protein
MLRKKIGKGKRSKMQFEIGLSKDSRIRLNHPKNMEMAERIVVDLKRTFGDWLIEAEVNAEPTQSPSGFKYEAKLAFSREIGGADSDRNIAVAYCNRIAPVHGFLCNETPDASGGVQMEELPPLTEEILQTYFGHIYDREAHIRLIHDSLRSAVASKFKVRHHLLLKGLPACAKTVLIKAFIDWLGPVYFFNLNAPALTKAGLEDQLIDRAIAHTLPPFIYCEEIEKTGPENVIPLLGVMDERAILQKTNARVGNIVVEVPCLVIATCNDEALLRRVGDGALFSRFSFKLTCGRPSAGTMRKILQDECEKIEGDQKWVGLVMSFLEEYKGILPDHDDPRQAKAFLSGGERLVTGEFFRDYLSVTGIDPL